MQLQNLQNSIAQPQAKIHLKGLIGSSFSIVVSQTFKHTDKPFLLIFNNKEEAAYYLNDLEQLVNEEDVLFYPESYRRPYQIEETNNANVLLRAEVLNRINSRKKPTIIVTYPDALFEKVVTKKELKKHTLKIAVGDELSIDFVNEVLFEYKFNRVDFVTEPGDFSLRGGIVDVFSFSHNKPYRIEFFGDEVDSIRTFDVETQLSIERIKNVDIIPNIANTIITEKHESFLKYISYKTVVFLKNASLLFSRIDSFYEKATEAFKALSGDIKQVLPKELFCDSTLLKRQFLDYSLVEFGTISHFSFTSNLPHCQSDTEEIPYDFGNKNKPLTNTEVINQVYNNSLIKFNTKPQPSFNKQFNILIDNLNENHANGISNYIACVSEQQAKRFHDIFEDVDQHVYYKTIVLSLHEGFIDKEHNIAVYTDHQIFDRYHKFYLKNGYSKKQAITLKELTNLKMGDYVTHIDHGIGKFGGLQKIDVEGKPQEAIKLVYGERDVLYLSIHSLHKITKFNGKDGKPPKVYKLGSKAWKTLKQKTKSRVKEIAFNLIKLYAKRKLKKGFQYAPDSYMQHELEASFIYEDTPDQITSTADIKTDMESERPMDRLVCGDVGFGKTEVAIRAAFKAVDNGKQVAVLVPTTILAYQHFRTFTERLKNSPVTVD